MNIWIEHIGAFVTIKCMRESIHNIYSEPYVYSRWSSINERNSPIILLLNEPLNNSLARQQLDS